MIRQTVCASLLVLVAGTCTSAQVQGPSSSQTPYLLPMPGFGAQVTTKSFLTTGDTIGGYAMVGTPDGLGYVDNNDGTFTMFANHEFTNDAGIVRAHGSTGALVSQWVVRKSDLTVISGRDSIASASSVYNWSGSTASPAWTTGTTQFNRFCSADLAAPSAYQWFDAGTNTTYGTSARIFLNGEESTTTQNPSGGATGRGWATVIGSGSTPNTIWQLPHAGTAAWENGVSNPYSQRKTIVGWNEDNSTLGAAQVYFYIGDKQTTGNDVQKAGLVGGNAYAIRAAGFGDVNGTETRPGITTAGQSWSFDLKNLGDASTQTAAQLNSAATSTTGGGRASNFARPEDGAWDPRPGHQNDYYFVTTDNTVASGGKSRLWRASFGDITNPTNGGNLTCLLTGNEGQNMMDNLCIDSHGRILITEDIGNNAALGKVWMYDIATGGFGAILTSDAARFDPNLLGPGIGGPGFQTQDEESSGVIDAKDILGDGWYLIDMQNHRLAGSPDTLGLVEGGQFIAFYADPSLVPAPGAAALLGMGGVLLSRRRRRS